MTIKKPKHRRLEVWKLRQRKAGAHKSKKDELYKLKQKEFDDTKKYPDKETFHEREA